MKVNKLNEAWTTNLGGCVELPADGHVVSVQCPPQADVLFTILHESVHVWQSIMSYMLEDSPGNETEAYTIEYIAKELMLQYQKATGESLAIPKERKKTVQNRKREVQLSPGCGEEASSSECSTQGNDEGGVSP